MAIFTSEEKQGILALLDYTLVGRLGLLPKNFDHEPAYQPDEIGKARYL